jgi:hypothetical protein
MKTWIPISERLPETSGWYQVWHAKMPSRLELQRIPTYYFDSTIGEWRKWHYSGEPSHWMPLPDAPSSEQINDAWAEFNRQR